MKSYNAKSDGLKEPEVNIATLVLDDYITIAELVGLWVMFESNVHLKRRTISVTVS